MKRQSGIRPGKAAVITFLTLTFIIPLSCGNTPENSAAGNIIRKELSAEEVQLSTTYLGNNTWAYTVSYEAPTPCYTLETEAVVMESYPEQVSIQAILIHDSEAICAQVITEISDTGTFAAGEEAEVRIN